MVVVAGEGHRVGEIVKGEGGAYRKLLGCWDGLG